MTGLNLNEYPICSICLVDLNCNISPSNVITASTQTVFRVLSSQNVQFVENNSRKEQQSIYFTRIIIRAERKISE